MMPPAQKNLRGNAHKLLKVACLPAGSEDALPVSDPSLVDVLILKGAVLSILSQTGVAARKTERPSWPWPV